MTTQDLTTEPEAAGASPAALAEVFVSERDRLRRTVQVRIDARLLGRVDPDDVLQESFLEASKRLHQYRSTQGRLFVWARMVVEQTLVDIARRHLGTLKRTIMAEIPLETLSPPGTHVMLTHHWLSQLTSPTRAAVRAEAAGRLSSAIAGMSELDREILLLRHFEELSNDDAAAVLGIHKAAATNRYLRALRRLREVLAEEDVRHGVA